MIRRPPRSTLSSSSAASDVYKRQVLLGAPPATPDAGRLLLAEDNLINQKVAVAVLTSGGYRVDTVLNGDQAVQAAAAQRYDAILMDCQMPELNCLLYTSPSPRDS